MLHHVAILHSTSSTFHFPARLVLIVIRLMIENTELVPVDVQLYYM